MSTQQARAVEIASRRAVQDGYDVSRYDISAQKKGQEWEVFFKRNGAEDKPSPGDFLMVFVDEAAGRVLRLVPGK